MAAVDNKHIFEIKTVHKLSATLYYC